MYSYMTNNKTTVIYHTTDEKYDCYITIMILYYISNTIKRNHEQLPFPISVG